MSKNNKPNQVKTCTLYVDGMHCASCELLIEKTLIEQEGIESVDASLKGNKVKIQYVGKSKPNIEKINTEFSELGYKFSQTQFKNTSSAPLLTFKNGTLEINPEKMNNLFKYIIIFLSFVALFFFIESLHLGKYAGVDKSSSIPAFFLLGVVAGLSSCAALIGGLLLSMIKQWNELYITNTNKEKAEPHIMFHVGRLVSFTIFGAVLGLIGEAISFNTVFFAVVTVAVSAVMIILALQMLGVVWTQSIKFTAPKSFTRFAANENNFRGRYMPFVIGAVTFFLPCGFTLAAQTIALTSGSAIQGALIMFAFALGTFPTLLAISYSGIAFNSKPQLTAKFNIIAGLVILFFALYNINGQLNVLGLPSLSDISLSGNEQGELIDANANGVQELNIIAQGFEYKPVGSTTIKAGVPTTLVVDNRGIQGCGAFMASTGLIDNYVELKKGINRIDIGSPAVGKYKLTCTMGMVPPLNIYVI